MAVTELKHFLKRTGFRHRLVGLFHIAKTQILQRAGLVEEDENGEATYLAEGRVFVFDQLLLVVDLDTISTAHTTELVVTAAQDTDSIYRAMDASVQIAGHGYQLQLPPAEDAGFHEGDNAPCQSARGILVISKDVGTAKAAAAARLPADRITVRNEQLN